MSGWIAPGVGDVVFPVRSAPRDAARYLVECIEGPYLVLRPLRGGVERLTCVPMIEMRREDTECGVAP